MKDGRFFAFDVPVYDGLDVGDFPLWRRLKILDSFNLLRPRFGFGRGFYDEVLANGGEGIVAKPLHSQFGWSWTKVKRIETFDLIVTEKHTYKSSVKLGDAGWCFVGSQETFDQIEVGHIVEVAGMCKTKSGKIREQGLLKYALTKCKT